MATTKQMELALALTLGRVGPAAMIALLAGSLAIAPRAHAQEALTQPPGEQVEDPDAGLDPQPPEGEEEVVGSEPPMPPVEGDYVTLDAFSEGIELTALVEYLVNTLAINVSVDPGLSGTVVLNAPIRVHKDELLDLVNSLLEQHGYGMTRTPSGFYNVLRIENLPATFSADAGSLATTRIIPTPNIVPSVLKETIEAAMRGRGTTGSGGGVRVTYLDDLGVIVATDTPGNIRAIEDLIAQIAAERGKVAFTRLELKFLSAPVARERALALVGQDTSSSPRQFADPNNPQGTTRFLDNLATRLSVDPLGNALIFRGRPDEVEQIRSLLTVIDATSALTAKRYFTGSATGQIADFAKQRGLGEVTKIQTGPTDQFQNQMQFQIDPNTGQLLQNSRTVGGTVLVADEYKGQIVYFATPEQQAQLDDLIKQFDTEGERVVIREYKLHHANAETVAEILLGLLQSSTPAADSPLLNTGTGQFRQNQTNRNRNFQRQPGDQSAEGEGTSLDSENAFVIADVDNNQVLVKAPFAQQIDFEKIISKLDLRRPQVYIEAKIVSLTTSDAFRLAFETQLINANGTGGVINTNFGLSTFPTGTGLNDPKTVATGLDGLTAAIIKSDQVPIIITALQNVAETRILSTPQLLVNDNEEATIASIRQEPTTTTSLGGGGEGSRDVTSFGGYEDAGTTLTVTPRISEGGYLRLEYEVQLSAFDGTGSDGIPPPRIENNVASSASLPTDFTIVVGGIEVDTKRKTVVKVPLLGDIPLVGHLFRDTNKNDATTRLYVFITPKIMRDETFADLRLLTRGPHTKSELDPELPEFEPSTIPLIDARPVAIEAPAASSSGSGTEGN